MSIYSLIEDLPKINKRAMELARARQDRLTKPTGSLGRLEDLSVRLAGMTGNPLPAVDPVVIFVFAADHGVAHRGVSAYPAEVTAQMVLNYAAGGAVINCLANQVGAKLVVSDVGVDFDFDESLPIRHCKVRKGTSDWSQAAAMTSEEAIQALRIGYDTVMAEPSLGTIVIGEMGIGNTATASALASAMLRIPSADITGRGTGVDGEALARKKAVVSEGVARISADAQPLDILTELGGFEIAAMAGAVLGATRRRVPVVLDGFISTVAALTAEKLAPGARDFMIASHRSQEAGHAAVLDALGLVPLLELGMRLGEGSGGAITVPIIRASAKVLAEVATFGEAGVSDRDEAHASKE